MDPPEMAIRSVMAASFHSPRHTGAVPWRRSSTVDHLPPDAVGEAVAAAISEILGGASVDFVYYPDDDPPPAAPEAGSTAAATGRGPAGWLIQSVVRLVGRVAPGTTPESTPLLQILHALPGAGLQVAERFRAVGGDAAAPVTPFLRRALRDTIVIETLGRFPTSTSDHPGATTLIAETVEFLIELSGSRVEAQDLTHGVVISDVLPDVPRLRFEYPADLRAAKRAPLLFDGQRSLLVVDREGRARSELQRHRLQHLIPGAPPLRAEASEFTSSGSFVAEATRRLGGIGFFLRADRTIWAFVDGQPLLVRRAEHWTAFPLELAAAIANVIGGGHAAAAMVVRAAFIISAQRQGAILAIFDDAGALDDVVSSKDRYDLRDAVDPQAMQMETRLHHLIDAEELDAETLARLAALDGATIIDRHARLLAYGAIVTSADSQHEGARTAAAKTLSLTAEIVLKVSVDGDITVFHAGEMLATLLG